MVAKRGEIRVKILFIFFYYRSFNNINTIMWHLGVQSFNIHFKTIVMEMKNGDKKIERIPTRGICLIWWKIVEHTCESLLCQLIWTPNKSQTPTFEKWKPFICKSECLKVSAYRMLVIEHYNTTQNPYY